jgi:hypothetical protein
MLTVTCVGIDQSGSAKKIRMTDECLCKAGRTPTIHVGDEAHVCEIISLT